jgi:hypothetical protein
VVVISSLVVAGSLERSDSFVIVAMLVAVVEAIGVTETGEKLLWTALLMVILKIIESATSLVIGVRILVVGVLILITGVTAVRPDTVIIGSRLIVMRHKWLRLNAG